MATKDVEKFLSEMTKFIEREYKRGALDKFSTIVTMTSRGFAEGFKQGYATVKGKRNSNEEERKQVLHISSKEFVEIGQHCIDEVAKWAYQEKTMGTVVDYVPGLFLVYRAKRDVKRPYTIAKNEGIRLINKKLQKAGQKTLRGRDKEKGISARGSEVGLVKSTVHRAHQGVTTVGAAQVSAALKFLDNTRGFGGFVNSEAAKDIRDVIQQIQATFTTTGTKSGSTLSKVQLNENLDVSLRVLGQSRNAAGEEPFDYSQLKPRLEKAIRQYILKADVGTMANSDSIEDDAVKRVEYAVIQELTAPKNSKLVGSNKKPAGRKKKDLSKEKKYKPTKRKGSTKKASTTASGVRVQAKPSQINLAQIMAILNAKITGTVAKNMGVPALTNRTGRFASSVRVTDVSLTPKGFPSVGYTYQKNPYQTFEQGFAQGTPELDPRDLVDKSIREIAAHMALGRLYTRRL